MKKLLSLFIFLLLLNFTYSQKQKADSLFAALDTAKSNTAKINIYDQLGNLFMFNNANKGIEFFEKAIALSSDTKDKYLIGKLYIMNGFCYRITDNFEKSLENYLNATRVFEKDDKSHKLSSAYISVAVVYSDFKNKIKANDYFAKAEELILKQKDSFELGHLYFEKGVLYSKYKLYDTSMLYFKQLYNLGKALDNPQLISNALSAIGETNKNEGNYELAIKYYDSVKIIYKKNNKKTPDLMAALYINYGEAYLKGKNIAEAKLAFEKSMEYAKSAGLIDIEMSNYKNLAAVFELQNDYKNQLVYLNKYHTIKDSLYTSDNKNKLTELEADYNIEKKNSEISKKQTEIKIGKAQRNIFVIVALALLLLFTTLGFFYTKIKKQNNLLNEKNIEIGKQRNELQTLNGVKDRLFSIISHDLRNPLVVLKSYLTLSDSKNISDEKKQVYKLQTTQAVKHTTDMLDNLLAWANMQIKNTTVNKTLIDIEEIILDAQDNVQSQAFEKNITIQKNIAVSNAIADKNILNIAVRNVLTNAIKYSSNNATIFIDVYQKNDSTYISIKDEGVGMTEEQIANLQSNQPDSTVGTQGEKGSGLGIFLVRELLEKCNNNLLIESKQNVGSTFTIML